MKKLISLTILLCSQFVFAASVSIPLEAKNQNKKPARDLMYEGEQIDAYRAYELKEQGLDLSNLNPKESGLWQNKKHPLNTIVIPQQEYSFNDFKISPTEFFRAYITGSDNSKRYVVTASLDNHENIIRAALLRSLGYKVEIPKFYKKLSINFKTEEEKIAFIEKVGEKTLTKRTKWIHADSTKTKLIIKDVILSDAKLKNVNIFIPVMVRDRQQYRRVFRSLLAIYSITKMNQSINAIPWKVGRSFNNFLMLAVPYADQFRDVSIDDLRWIQKRINRLSPADLKQAVELSNYPDEVKGLIVQKLISRINSLNQHLSLPSTMQFNRKFSNSVVKQGKLTKDIGLDRVPEYFKVDEKSPYNFKDLFRLFKSQATYNLLSKVLDDSIEKFVPGLRVGDASGEIQEQISDYRLDNKLKTGENMPVKLFSYPTANVSAQANRNIVFGKQFGRTAPIQLVDTISASANLGVFSMLTGLSDTVIPSISASVGLTRNYTHVRAMPNLETATAQQMKKILVPRLMKKLGNMINLEIVCSLGGTVNVVESTVDGNKYVYLKYDKKVENARELAIKKRTELIEGGVSEDIILLVPIDLEDECIAEIDDTKSENLNEFMKEFALNETFIISDTVNLISTGTAAIPLDTFMGTSLNASIRGDVAKGLLRIITLRKLDKHLEVTIQKQKNLNKSLGVSLNYFVDIVRGTSKWIKGKQKSLIYKVPLEGIEEGKKDVVMNTLHQLFANNSLHLLEENFSPIELEHEVKGKLNSIKFLWYKNEHLKLDNQIEIVLPEDEHPNLNRKERTKNLFTTSSVRRNGKDIFGFFNSVLNRVSSFISFGQNSQDPGQAIKGSSKLRYYTTEADVSYNITPVVTTKVDYIWKGWSASPKKLFSMFNFIEGLFDETQVNYLIDRTKFQNKGDLMGYEVKMTLIVYPEFLENFKKRLIESSEADAINFLKQLYGEKKWRRYCSRRRSGPAHRRSARNSRNCKPATAKRMLKYRKYGLPTDKVKLVKTYNKILVSLLEGYDRKKVIKWIGPKNFFSSTRVTGFKEKSEKGYVDYITNTYGHYNRTYGTGIFDKIGSLLGISPYELRALNYTPGF